jgi:hypothetical protein
MEPNLSPPRLRGALVLVGAVALLASNTGCSNNGTGAPTVPGPSAGEMPAVASVAGGTVVVGFKRGKLRQNAPVESFRVTKHPITVAQYRACVAKGACAEPSMRTPACRGAGSHGVLDRATYEIAGSDALPVTCATVDEAKQYCAWIGGALPTNEQWMLAARGPSVARYAWGDDEPTCERRGLADGICAPYAIGSLQPPPAVVAVFGVGGHPSGASPSGVEDVLMTPGELLAPSPAAFFTACAPPGHGCVVDGMAPAAIDSVAPATDDAPVPTPSFRCALPEVSE